MDIAAFATYTASYRVLRGQYLDEVACYLELECKSTEEELISVFILLDFNINQLKSFPLPSFLKDAALILFVALVAQLAIVATPTTPTTPEEAFAGVE